MIKKITLIALALLAYAFSSDAATFKLYISCPDGDIPFVHIWGASEGYNTQWPGISLDENNTINRSRRTWFVYEIQTDATETDKTGATVGKIGGLVINDGGGQKSPDYKVNMVGEGWYIVTDWADQEAGYEDVTATYYPNRPDIEEPVEYDPEWLPELEYVEGKTFAYCVNDTKGSSVNVWAWNTEGNLFAAWPGLAIEKYCIDGHGFEIYRWVKADDLADPVNIIFSNAGSPQTADLEFVNGGVYFIGNDGGILKVLEPGDEPGPQPKKGDLNGDDQVNAGDVSELYTLILNGAYDQKADLNNDGQVNAGDVSELYSIILAGA